ncbi:MAG: hypothetical protein CM15mP103_03880 [Gammaproteobacteria bacterium]|nr:MAG: hypothetical protein CM15mP103_03880 [Gammaproteobacteria bacterium]
MADRVDTGSGARCLADITLVESPDIPIIGVVKVPGLRCDHAAENRRQRKGASERVDATFKQGTEFIGWRSESEAHVYYHPFSLPAEYASLNLAEHWLASNVTSDFCATVTPQAGVISASGRQRPWGA